MTTHMLQTYREHLLSAAEAVRRHDRKAAQFCLGQAMQIANRAENGKRYRSAVMRAMNFVRVIPQSVEG